MLCTSQLILSINLTVLDIGVPRRSRTKKSQRCRSTAPTNVKVTIQIQLMTQQKMGKGRQWIGEYQAVKNLMD